MKDVDLNLDEATFLVEGQNGIELDVEDLKETIETWGGYDYKVGEAQVIT